MIVGCTIAQQADRADLLIAKIKSLESSLARVPSTHNLPSPIGLDVDINRQKLSYCVASPFGRPTSAIVSVYLWAGSVGTNAWQFNQRFELYYEFRAAGNPTPQAKAVLDIGSPTNNLMGFSQQVIVPLNDKGCFEYQQFNVGPMGQSLAQIQLLGYQYILNEFMTTSIPVKDQFALNFTIHNRFNASHQMGFGYALKSNEANGNWNITSGYYFNDQYYVYSNGKLILDQDLFNSTINLFDKNRRRRSLEEVNNTTSIGVCINKFLILPDDAIKAALQLQHQLKNISGLPLIALWNNVQMKQCGNSQL